MAKVANPQFATQFRALHDTPTLAQIYDKIIQRRVEPILQPKLGPEILGFRKHHQVHELMLYFRALIRHCKEWGMPFFSVEADVKKACDESEHGEISEALCLQGVDNPEICALHRERCSKTTVYQANGFRVTDPMKNERGAPQGQTTSPLCFRTLLNICLEESGEVVCRDPPCLQGFNSGKLV